jgi:hypothetical protein
MRPTPPVKLAINYRGTNNYGAFSCVVNCWLYGESSREANSIDIHRNIRFLSVFMLNVEMQMSYQHFKQVSGPDSGTQ